MKTLIVCVLALCGFGCASSHTGTNVVFSFGQEQLSCSDLGDDMRYLILEEGQSVCGSDIRHCRTSTRIECSDAVNFANLETGKSYTIRFSNLGNHFSGECSFVAAESQVVFCNADCDLR